MKIKNQKLNKKSIKKNKTKKSKKEKILIGVTIAMHIINFLLLAGFFVYLYFWVKSR